MKKTHIFVVLDSSGSMFPLRGDVIGGFNSFLREQQEQKGEAVLTLIQFDSRVKTTIDNRDLKDIKPLTESSYSTGGTTALLDAIGMTINSAKTTIKTKCKSCGEGKTEQVIFVVMTDGLENDSREYNLKQIHDMIREAQEDHDWGFIFLGANQDAIQAGHNYGVNIGTCATYDASSAGTACAFSISSESVSSYRSSGTVPEFTEKQRDELGSDKDGK